MFGTAHRDSLFVLPLRIVLVEVTGHDRIEHPLQHAAFRVHKTKPVSLPFRQILRTGIDAAFDDARDDDAVFGGVGFQWFGIRILQRSHKF